MKRYVYFALVIAMVLCIPFNTHAMTLEPHIPEEVEEKPTVTKNDDGTITKTFKIYVTPSEDNLTALSPTFKFTFGPAIKSFECGDPSSKRFVAQTNANEDKCTFTAPEGETIKGKVNVGTISITIDPKSQSKDCTISYQLGEITGKVNPNTGANVPFLYVIGGIVLAAGIYFATSRKTKFHRI